MLEIMCFCYPFIHTFKTGQRAAVLTVNAQPWPGSGDPCGPLYKKVQVRTRGRCAC